MRVCDDTILNAQAVTNQTTTSSVVSLDHLFGFSVQASWTGTTISGSIKVQCSIDGVTWFDVPSSEQTINASGSYLWNVAEAMYRYMRVSTTSNDANTITFTVIFYAKGF